MKVIDLFSGLGGLTIGAYEAAKHLGSKFEIILASDINSFCKDVYNYNFDVKNFHSENIVDLEVNKIRKENIDYLFAGPPCQGNSDLNNKSRRNDSRNNLYLETLKVIDYFQPNVFLIENVPNVIHSSQGVVKTVSEFLTNKYYIKEFIIDFECLGIAQTRKRHILLGSKNPIPDDMFENIYLKFQKKNLRDAIADLEICNYSDIYNTPSRMSNTNKERVNYLLDNDLYDLPNKYRPKCHQGNHSYKSMYGRLNWDKPSQTITGGFGSMGQGRFLHPTKARVITPHEAARIQGIPDWYDFSVVNSRGALQQMIGNAVPPVLSKELIIFMENYKNE
ncbi:DNA cytosine methyltransferase [Photobacterium leiognathi]|uniref:DNA cytosine methyltransferase n=1 Tax=Photobacterium leiognathi TaxID=553611 RepID=UPI002980F009|nr:DNA cytosine methyltransferase [Photobacterium leiognathi]